ncbi:hypothetical protein [Streptomyces chromofuscus]|uniref:Secreted protein n=1 Tax=Streptomyces chromofuscus TaxID=42881 RepID=A0A7M2T7K1_STRCW|nr:hypothetical protein [Streptomyces chromofuscus]QOV44194.1 hypothetical protein IPT68_31885 [Streptomyces chromofuscus]GGT31869.1 hypothetical protein GCM10010254_60600 [Streptomyces chromofuscus]
MDDPRPPAPAAPWNPLPPPALGAFLLLLAAVFVVSYGVGSTVGPIGPGMHRTDAGTDAGTGDTDPHTGSGTHGDHPEGHAP